MMELNLFMTISIKKIILHKLQMSLKNPFKTSFGVIQDKDFFVIEAIDYDGNSGYGESVAFSSPWYTEETVQTNYHMIKDFLLNILENNQLNHPDDVSDLFSVVKGNHMAKAAIEGAIWDLYAKQKGISLSEALGGEKPTIDVGISLGIQPTIEELLKKIEVYVQAGYKRVKLKIMPGHDVKMLQEVRHYFPDLPLMADANCAYTLKDSDHLKRLDDFDLIMIEQPLAHNDIIDHSILQAHIQTPICLDESIHSLEDTRLAIKLGSCQIINIKTGRVGGLTEAKKIHDHCKMKGIPVWCGGMLEAGIGRAHNIALASLTQFTFPGDIGESAHYWNEDIINPEVIVKNGQIKVPSESGIGYHIDQQALKKHTVFSETIQL